MSLATDVARGTRSCLEEAARPLNAVSRAKAPRRNGINPCDSNPLRRGMRHAQAHRRRRRQSARWTASAGEGCTTQGAYQPELSGNPTTMPLETIHSPQQSMGELRPRASRREAAVAAVVLGDWLCHTGFPARRRPSPVFESSLERGPCNLLVPCPRASVLWWDREVAIFGKERLERHGQRVVPRAPRAPRSREVTDRAPAEVRQHMPVRPEESGFTFPYTHS